MRLGRARGATNTPEKQAEMITTVGRSPQASSTISERPAGVSMPRPTSTPSGLPCELK